MVVLIVLADGLSGMGGIARSMTTLTRAMKDYPDIELHVFAMRRNPANFAWMMMLPIRIVQLLYKLLFLAPDIVHINISSQGSSLRKFIAWLLSKSLGKRVILHLHSSSYETFFESIPGFWAAMIRWMFRNSDRVIVLGEVWAKYVANVLTVPAERIRIVNNAVADPEVSVALEGASCNIVFLGAVGERKGIPELLNAVARPEVRERSWHLRIAGNGDLEKYEAVVRDAGLESRVQFEGWVDKRRVRQLLLSSQILVLPSRAENQPLSVLEGMSYGMAVIATRVGAVPEVISDRENGLLVDVQDEVGLARALVELLDDESLRIAIGSAARRSYVQRYRPDAQAAALMSVYKEVLAER